MFEVKSGISFDLEAGDAEGFLQGEAQEYEEANIDQLSEKLGYFVTGDGRGEGDFIKDAAREILHRH